MKQTAVEWLYDNLKSHFEHDGDLLEVVQFSFEQAKEMEKLKQEQTIEEVFEWLTTQNYVTDLKETMIKDFKNFKNK